MSKKSVNLTQFICDNCGRVGYSEPGDWSDLPSSGFYGVVNDAAMIMARGGHRLQDEEIVGVEFYACRRSCLTGAVRHALEER